VKVSRPLIGFCLIGEATSLRTKLLQLESVGGNIFQWRSPAPESQQILTLDPLPDRGPNDRPESPEAPGLIVYPTSVRIEGWAPSVRVEPTLELFLSDYLPADRESMADGFESMPDDLKRRLEMAYSLVHLALLNIDPGLKYIFLMTAVEALIPDEKPERGDRDVVVVLGTLREQVMSSGDMNRRLRKRVDGILKYAQKETITQLGINLAQKLERNYDGLPPGEFFAKYYDGRSAVVHGSIDEERRPEPGEIERRLPHLQQFVMDLLEVEAASADDGADETER
jgi:hypothetical protein